MRLIVAAEDGTNGIGRQSRLPWRIAADLERFKALTMGGTVVMGRRTWESLPAKLRPLPGRRNVVLTSRHGNPDLARANVICGSLTIASRLCPDAWVIGGGQVYAEALSLGLVTTIELTRVRAVEPLGCDTFWPGVPADFEPVPGMSDEPNVWRRASDTPDAPTFRFESWRRP